MKISNLDNQIIGDDDNKQANIAPRLEEEQNSSSYFPLLLVQICISKRKREQLDHRFHSQLGNYSERWKQAHYLHLKKQKIKLHITR